MLKEVLLKAAEVAGKTMLEFAGKKMEIDVKSEGKNNFVTAADYACEKAILSIVQQHFPDHNILTEEAGSLWQENEYQWVIDPIDGTTNFFHGIPLCCTSIALQKGGETILGAVFNPFMNELFFAEKGKGASINQTQTLQVSRVERIENACIVTDFPYDPQLSQQAALPHFIKLINQGVPTRRLGSGALDLCWLAAGRFDAFYQYNLAPWDTAAAALIIQEAGGTVTDFSGHPFQIQFKGVVASNGILHEQLLGSLNG